MSKLPRSDLRSRLIAAGLLVLSAGACAQPAPPAKPARPMPPPPAEQPCAIGGDPIQWMADYCMAHLGTDDEIAASDCIQEQSRLRFVSECKTKEHFKRELCLIVIANGSVQGPVERCLLDPAFKGSVVENDGVGS